MAIQAVLDLSGDLGPARSQGRRSTCMAFAMSDLNRLVADAPDVLSAEFLYQTAGALTPAWRPGMGLRTTEAIQATHSPGQPLEAHFPYQAVDPTCAGRPTAPAGALVFSSHLNGLSRTTTQSVVDELSRGSPVGLVTRVTLGLFSPTAGVVPHEANVVPNAFHALLAVGWGTDPVSGMRHVLIRNSWGTTWALAGHAWLPEPFVDIHVLEVFGR